jgi:hypothetical protein
VSEWFRRCRRPWATTIVWAMPDERHRCAVLLRAHALVAPCCSCSRPCSSPSSRREVAAASTSGRSSPCGRWWVSSCCDRGSGCERSPSRTTDPVLRPRIPAVALRRAAGPRGAAQRRASRAHSPVVETSEDACSVTISAFRRFPLQMARRRMLGSDGVHPRRPRGRSGLLVPTQRTVRGTCDHPGHGRPIVGVRGARRAR